MGFFEACHHVFDRIKSNADVREFRFQGFVPCPSAHVDAESHPRIVSTVPVTVKSIANAVEL